METPMSTLAEEQAQRDREYVARVMRERTQALIADAEQEVAGFERAIRHLRSVLMSLEAVRTPAENLPEHVQGAVVLLRADIRDVSTQTVPCARFALLDLLDRTRERVAARLAHTEEKYAAKVNALDQLRD